MFLMQCILLYWARFPWSRSREKDFIKEELIEKSGQGVEEEKENKKT